MVILQYAKDVEIKMIDKIEKKLIESAIRVVRDGEGCLFVIKQNALDYEPLIKNDLEPFSIFEDTVQKRLDILAKTDGACIINDKGQLVGYGMRINSQNTLNGYGTRHSAAYSSSLKGNIAVLGSQESKKIRIFKEGKMIMQIDALEKNIDTSKAVNILESVGVGALGTLGIGILGITGLALIPGIILFGSSHFIIKYLANKEKQNANM